MLIIVEGPDGAGKTTFVKELSEALNRNLVCHTTVATGPPKPDADPYEEYEHRLDGLHAEHEVVVADRWHWGEPVYGPLLRNKDRLGVAGWRHVELSLLFQGTIVVNLHQQLIVLVDRLVERGDDLITTSQLGEVVLGYERCVRNTALPVLNLRDPTAAEAEDLVQIIKYRQGQTPTRFNSYLGSRWPEVLLVGERKGGPKRPTKDRLAFTPRRSGSGRWLLEALPEYLWPNVGLVNAYEDVLAEVWMDTGHPPVVALGHEASRRLRGADIEHAAVPHPQFVRRFLHRYLQEYGHLIGKVAGTTEDHLNWKGIDSRNWKASK